MHLPARFAAVILTFAPVSLQQRTWRRAELLLIGAILAPGKRTVTSLLRITGLAGSGGSVRRTRPDKRLDRRPFLLNALAARVRSRSTSAGEP